MAPAGVSPDPAGMRGRCSRRKGISSKARFLTSSVVVAEHREHPTRPSAVRGYSGPNSSRTLRSATRKANCGRAAAAPSRCRCVPPGCHINWAGCGPKMGPMSSLVVFGKPLVRSWLLKPFELYEGTLTRRSPAQVGRVYPKPPRCSPIGDANGARNPEQHEQLSINRLMPCSQILHETHPKVEVRVAAAVSKDHCSGF